MNGVPCFDLIIDNKRSKPIPNAVLVLNGEIEEKFWCFEGISMKVNTRNESSTLEVFGNEGITKTKFIGIFDRKFILCHLGGVLYAIDQHAARERVNLERIPPACRGSSHLSC